MNIQATDTTAAAEHTVGDQRAAVEALLALGAAHPELPSASWRIDQHAPGLCGDLQGAHATFDALTTYAHVLGGSIRPRHEFSSGLVRYRSHELVTTWCDVDVRVALYVPLPVSNAYLAEGRAAEWKHQFGDEAEPPAYVSARPSAPAAVAVTA